MKPTEIHTFYIVLKIHHRVFNIMFKNKAVLQCTRARADMRACGHTHTHTNTHTYMYMFVFVFLYVFSEYHVQRRKREVWYVFTEENLIYLHFLLLSSYNNTLPFGNTILEMISRSGNDVSKIRKEKKTCIFKKDYVLKLYFNV